VMVEAETQAECDEVAQRLARAVEAALS
jgi:hypothetical protein